MLGILQKSGQALFDLLYPQKCVNCQAENSWLCDSCFHQIDFITATICIRCGTPKTLSNCRQCDNHPLQYIDSIRSAAYFEDNPIRTAIHGLKYRNHKTIAGLLATILADTCHRYRLHADVIVPVPLHPSRIKERGFNQSELLARQLANVLTLPVNVTSLQRVRKTQTQMTLGAEDRRKNVAAAFACQNTQLVGQQVLLIDDVCTTGATLDFCAAALKEAGAGSVFGLTLAKAR